jgi:hypothetical protein
MPKRLKPRVTEQPLPFTYDDETGQEGITALGGMPVLVQTFRSLAVGGSVRRNVTLKQRQRGLSEDAYVESFVILNAAGGDCLEDFEQLRADDGLRELIGHEMPSSEAARKFLYQFHDDTKVEEAQQQALSLGQRSYIPEENAALQGLGTVNREMIQEFGRRSGDKIATIDLDATVIESWKREAQPTYQGGTGYQPMLALWAELNAIVADEFRDGNVGAHTQLLPVAQQAFAALPTTVEQRYFRGDSACYEQDLMRWLRNRKRPEGPEGFIGFGISAKMSDSLRERLRMLPEGLWKPYREDTEADWEFAELQNWDPLEKAGEELDHIRYLAIRVHKKQGELFSDGKLYKYYAVVTNRWDHDAKRLLEWQREKAGTIEAAHEVLKNELTAGVMPCGRFGANAAWLRLALPAELLNARPKRLRFLIFNTAGRIIHHARSVICRLKHRGQIVGGWRTVLAALPLPQPA